MPWFKVDDGLSSSLKTTRIPRARRAAAMGLWVLAGSWSARELTDGFIPAHMVDELACTIESAEDLVAAEYWSIAEGGWQMADWAVDQPTRTEVEEKRRKNTEKVAAWRQNKRGSNQPSSNPVTDSGTNQVDNPAPVPDPYPAPENASHSQARTRRKKPETRLPKDWAPNADHMERARTLGIDVTSEAETFRLHAESHDRHAANWNSAFTMWLKKAKAQPSTAPRRDIPKNDEWMYR